MLASVCSVVGNADEFFSGMVSPFLSSCGDGFGRCGQLHVLGTQQAGLADLGDGVFRQPDALLQPERQGGHPVLHR